MSIVLADYPLMCMWIHHGTIIFDNVGLEEI